MTFQSLNCKPNKLCVCQGWELLGSNILIYSAYYESKSVIAKRFLKTLKAKIYLKITAEDIKSYLYYLNKSVDQCNNAHHPSIHENPIYTDCFTLTEKNKANSRAHNFKVDLYF